MTDKEATAFLVLTPRWQPWNANGEPVLRDVRVSRVTQSRPESIKGDELVMKLRIKVPARAFKPLAPEVVIDVPEGLLITGEAIVASAEDPHE